MRLGTRVSMRWAGRGHGARRVSLCPRMARRRASAGDKLRTLPGRLIARSPISAALRWSRDEHCPLYVSPLRSRFQIRSPTLYSCRPVVYSCHSTLYPSLSHVPCQPSHDPVPLAPSLFSPFISLDVLSSLVRSLGSAVHCAWTWPSAQNPHPDRSGITSCFPSILAPLSTAASVRRFSRCWLLDSRLHPYPRAFAVLFIMRLLSRIDVAVSVRYGSSASV